MKYVKIVHALTLCGSTSDKWKCRECPYNEGDMSKCIPKMTMDAAGAITSLFAKVKQQDKEIADREESYAEEHGELHYWRDRAREAESKLRKIQKSPFPTVFNHKIK